MKQTQHKMNNIFKIFLCVNLVFLFCAGILPVKKVFAQASLSVNPANVSPGGNIAVSWSGVATPTAKDWVGIYLKSATDDKTWKDWFYIGSCTKTAGIAKASGSCFYIIPSTWSVGTYQARLFANNVYAKLATGNDFAISKSCVDKCQAIGATQCNGSSYQYCADTNGDGCNEWSSPAACPSGQSCQNGQCGAAACLGNNCLNLIDRKIYMGGHYFGSLLFDTGGHLVVDGNDRTWIYWIGGTAAPWKTYVSQMNVDTQELYNWDQGKLVKDNDPADSEIKDEWSSAHDVIKLSDSLYLMFYTAGVSGKTRVRAAMSTAPDGNFTRVSGFQISPQKDIYPWEDVSLESNGMFRKISEDSRNLLAWVGYEHMGGIYRIGWAKVSIDKIDKTVTLVEKYQNNPLNSLMFEGDDLSYGGGNMDSSFKIGGKSALFYLSRKQSDGIDWATLALSDNPLFDTIFGKVKLEAEQGVEKVLEKFQYYSRNGFLYLLINVCTGEGGTAIHKYKLTSQCTNICAKDAKQCVGNSVQTCGDTNADGCYEWSVPAVCSNSQTCFAGVCLTAKANPIGYFDGADCSYGFSGWACDADNYVQPLAVHFYADGQAGSGGKFVGAVTANLTREKAVGNLCGGNASHGFSFDTPAGLKDGKKHTIYAYAINIPQGVNPLLGTNAKVIQCATAQAPAASNFVKSISQAAQANILAAIGQIQDLIADLRKQLAAMPVR